MAKALAAKIIRLGAIDTFQKVEQLAGELAACQKNLSNSSDSSLRISSYQLNTPHYEWDEIVTQHQYLALAETQIAHIVIPTAHTYTSVAELSVPPITQRNIDKLCRQINAEGWLVYCGWLKEEMEKALKTFQPTDAAMYTLQALLEDLCHEVESPLLFQHHTQILDAMRSHATDPTQLLETEKRIVAAREQMVEIVEAVSQILERIAIAFAQTADIHPEMTNLRRSCQLMQKTIQLEQGSWTHRILLSQLLDDALNVFACVNSDTQSDRTLWAYAARFALSELMLHHSKEELDVLVFEWDHNNQNALAHELRSHIAAILKKALNLPPKQKRGTFLADAGSLQPNPHFMQLLPQPADLAFLQEISFI